MTTAEVLSAIYETKSLALAPLSTALGTWLLDDQEKDGRWTDRNEGEAWDTSATAWSVWALSSWNARASAPALRKAVRWLEESALPSGGLPTNRDWTTPNTYASAYGLRALRATSRTAVAAACTEFLNRAQNPDGGWGLVAGEKSEPTLTSYVLHCLLDAGRTAATPALEAGMAFLERARDSESTWSSWLEESASVEGTAFATYVLVRARRESGFSLKDAIGFLGRSVASGTSWRIHDVDHVWVAVSALLAVNETLTRLGENAS